MRILLIFLSFCLGFHLTCAEKPRLLVTTDIGGDPDDQQSLVRLMVYSNEFDIEGMISSAAGTPGELGKNVIKPQLIEDIIDAYGKVYENLKRHDVDYPSPEKMHALVKRGNPMRGWDMVGEGNDTEGSEWIIKMADKDDDRPLNICIFGGQTDLAQALWKVKNNRTHEQYDRFISRIRVFDIADQDRIFEQIFSEHPALFYVLSKAPEGMDKREAAFRGMYLGGDESLTSVEWLQEHVTENHGALGKMYPTKTWTAPNPHGAMKEGDTPSWFFFMSNGLNMPEQPDAGSWGGRYQQNAAGYYTEATDVGDTGENARSTVYRWRADFQNDWAARMDRCVKSPAQVNHPPVIVLNQSKDNKPLRIRARPGEIIELDASKTIDPDGDLLEFECFAYPFFSGVLNVTTESPGIMKIIMPEIDNDEVLQIVLSVKDHGNPSLTSYKRIILYREELR